MSEKLRREIQTALDVADEVVEAVEDWYSDRPAYVREAVLRAILPPILARRRGK